jgi:predicted nucleic acid-binding protein
MAWCFEDENSPATDDILGKLKRSTAVVPTIWPLEVANVLLASKRRKRINDVQIAEFLDSLSALPIVVDPSTTSRAMQSIFVLAGRLDLTIYDASYLELALREGIPLITLDKLLINAARKLNVPLALDN